MITFSDACTIQLEDWVVVTGGTDRPDSTVSVYDVNGWVEDLPDLNQGRDEHGCGYYVDSSNNIVSLQLEDLKTSLFHLFQGLSCNWRPLL